MTAHNPHPPEEDLILRFYGESAHPAAIHAHLALCNSCQSESSERCSWGVPGLHEDI